MRPARNPAGSRRTLYGALDQFPVAPPGAGSSPPPFRPPETMMIRAARLSLPLVAAAIGAVLGTGFRAGGAHGCDVDTATAIVQPLHDVARPGAATPAEAVTGLLATPAVSGLRLPAISVHPGTGPGEHVLTSAHATIGLATTYALPAGGHAVDRLAVCLPPVRP